MVIETAGVVASVDLAFLPIGGTDTTDADEAVATIGPEYVVPMHDTVTSRGAFAESVEAEAVGAARPERRPVEVPTRPPVNSFGRGQSTVD